MQAMQYSACWRLETFPMSCMIKIFCYRPYLVTVRKTSVQLCNVEVLRHSFEQMLPCMYVAF